MFKEENEWFELILSIPQSNKIFVTFSVPWELVGASGWTQFECQLVTIIFNVGINHQATIAHQ